MVPSRLPSSSMRRTSLALMRSLILSSRAIAKFPDSLVVPIDTDRARAYHRLLGPVNVVEAKFRLSRAVCGGAATATPATNAIEAIAAVNRPVAPGLERDFCRLAAAAARHIEHLAVLAWGAAEGGRGVSTLALAASLGATGAAALRLGEAARSVKLLVVPAKQELLPAV